MDTAASDIKYHRSGAIVGIRKLVLDPRKLSEAPGLFRRQQYLQLYVVSEPLARASRNGASPIWCCGSWLRGEDLNPPLEGGPPGIEVPARRRGGLEEDFLFVRFRMDHFFLGMDAREGHDLLERYEKVLEGPADTRLAVCRALLASDGAAFDEALARLMEEREVRFRKLAANPAYSGTLSGLMNLSGFTKSKKP